MDRREYWFLRQIESYLNVPYRWGGADPTGIDCSGLVIEGLRAVGLMGNSEDLTAHGLYHKFRDRRIPKAKRGALVFWFRENGKAHHVAVCLDEDYCLTADGGGRHVHTLNDAVDYNAFVKIRPISHRAGKCEFLYPF